MESSFLSISHRLLELCTAKEYMVIQAASELLYRINKGFSLLMDVVTFGDTGTRETSFNLVVGDESYRMHTESSNIDRARLVEC